MYRVYDTAITGMIQTEMISSLMDLMYSEVTFLKQRVIRKIFASVQKIYELIPQQKNR